LILLFLVHSIITLFVSRFEEKKRWPRILNIVNAVESNLKRAGPTTPEEIIDESLPANDTPDSFFAGPIKKASIFAGPAGDIEIEIGVEEEEAVQYKRVDIQDATEIVFKGVTGDLVLVNVRRKMDEQWYEQGFPIKAGEQIGTEKIIGGKKVNFTTNCVLQDIVGKAQKPVTVMKKVAILNEKGGFVGTRRVPGETFMKSTSKIVYKDDQGTTKELWLGETAVIVEETPKEGTEWYEDPVGTVKSKYKDVTKALEPSTEDESAVKDVTE
jgi:hypothetical protein